MRVLDQALAGLGVGMLGRNTLMASAGLAARAVLQAAYLIVLSRVLGPADYGLFAGTVAAAVVLSPLAGWGATHLYARSVARDPGLARAMWGRTLALVGASGSLLALLFLLAGAWWLELRLDWPAMVAIAAAELLALPVALAAGRALMVAHLGGRAALALLLVPAGRLACVGAAVMATASATPSLVAYGHLAGSLLGGLAAYVLLAVVQGPPEWRGMPISAMARQGTPYAVASGAGTSYPEIDKPLILQLVGAAAAGLYSAAFRVVGLFTLPVAALVAATTPRLFAASDGAARDFIMRRVTLVALAYGMVAGGTCFLVAPLVPWVFGADFAGAADYVRWLSAWLPLYALHQCVGLRLTCGGREVQRAVIEVVGLAAVVICNLTLLPCLGALGSVGALLVGEVMMIAGCWLAARLNRPHEGSSNFPSS